jgi:hypothetical protein
MPHRLVCTALLFLFLSLSFACSKTGDRFYWQRSPEADFKSIRTYAVEKNLEPFFDARERMLAVDLRKEIESEIHTQMAAKGFARAEAGRQADVVVRFYGGPEQTAFVEQVTPRARESGRVPAPSTDTRYVPHSAGGSMKRLAERSEGRLAIEIVNPRTGKGLWRGTVEQAIPQQAGGDWAGPLRQAVAGVLKEFPPK